MSYGPRDFLVSRNFGVEVWTSDRAFEKLFRLLFTLEKKFPEEGLPAHAAPLPTLFVGAEKTQVRQVPLVTEPPWPFRFLLELGGMVVVKTDDRAAMFRDLRQFLNNHPQY